LFQIANTDANNLMSNQLNAHSATGPVASRWHCARNPALREFHFPALVVKRVGVLRGLLHGRDGEDESRKDKSNDGRKP